MKALCPVCNQIGILEERGNSQRIVHYQYVDGKRILNKHKVDMGTNGNNMGTGMGTEKANTSPNCDLLVRSPGFEPGLSAWEADVLPS
jgi:hypothetical protein